MSIVFRQHIQHERGVVFTVSLVIHFLFATHATRLGLFPFSPKFRRAAQTVFSEFFSSPNLPVLPPSTSHPVIEQVRLTTLAPAAPLPPKALPQPLQKRQRKVVWVNPTTEFLSDIESPVNNTSINVTPLLFHSPDRAEFHNDPEFTIPDAPPPPLPPESKEAKVEKQTVPIPLPSDPIGFILPPPPPPPQPEPKRKKAKQQTAPVSPQPEQIAAKEPETLSSIHFLALGILKLFFEICIVLDTEATGLGNGHKLTEIGCVAIKNMKITGAKFHSLINPEREVDEEAQELTGHTKATLSQSPIFSDIAENFLDFIKDARFLVLHNKHYDLKLIREALERCQNYYRIEDEHYVVDTYFAARQLRPHTKNNLTALCEYYGIDRENQRKHTALGDAEDLAKAFCQMIQKDHRLFTDNVNIEGLRIDFDQEFEPIKNTVGEKLFLEMGIQHDLPPTFRFMPDMYHPVLQRHYPAILTAFTDYKGYLSGIYARYLIPHIVKTDTSQEAEPPIPYQRIFFGAADNALVDIYVGNPKTVFVGKIRDALVMKDIMLGDAAEKVYDTLDIKGGFSIKACLDFPYLSCASFDHRTRKVVILMDHSDKKGIPLKREIAKLIAPLFNHSFVGLQDMVKQESKLTGYRIRYREKDWIVIDDQNISNKRILKLRKEEAHDLAVVIDLKDKFVTIKDRAVEDPNTKILVGHPSIILQIVLPKNHKRKETHQQIVQRCHNSITITNLQDLEQLPNSIFERQPEPTQEILETRRIELSQIEQKKMDFEVTIAQARRMYAYGLPLTDKAPVTEYFRRRGIQYPLPESFRYLLDVYHSWTDKRLPVTLVPLFKADGTLTGVHRLFCEKDGHPVQNCNKKVRKVSLGDAVGVSADIYQGKILGDKQVETKEEPSVVLVSEGIENALVTRDVMVDTARHDPDLAQRMYNGLGITDTFAIKSCVGINGLIGIPIGYSTHTVVIVADNDGSNIDTKRTLRETVAFFLDHNRNVKIVLPQDPHRPKVDLNDIYLSNGGSKTVAETLYSAITIENIEQMGPDNEPLETSLRKIVQQPHGAK